MLTALLLLGLTEASAMAVNIGVGAQQGPAGFLGFLRRRASPVVAEPAPQTTDAMSQVLVSDYMTPSAKLITLDPATPLRDAAQTILDNRVSGAPVVSKGVLVGVLSRTDLMYKAGGLRSLHVSGQGARSTRYMENTKRLLKMQADSVSDAMTAKVISVTPQATMQDAAAIMLRRKHNRLMVANEAGELVGMITASDVVRLTLEADGA